MRVSNTVVWPRFSVSGKLKCFHTSDSKLAVTSARPQTLFLAFRARVKGGFGGEGVGGALAAEPVRQEGPRWRPPATVEDFNLERSYKATAAKIRETARSESSSCQPRTLLRVKLSGKGSAPCVGWKQRQLTVCLSVSLVPLAKAWII